MLGGGFHCHTRHMRYLPLLLLLAGISVLAETIHQGIVVKIADVDTLTLLVDSQQHKIRLSDIDTPKRKQPFGTRAKQALSELAFDKQVRVVEVTVDRYGRIVGRVYVGEIDVNRELVAEGLAWVYRKYSNDAELLRLEAEAKQKGLGLWADPNPIPPWEWRRGRRELGCGSRQSSMSSPGMGGARQSLSICAARASMATVAPLPPRLTTRALSCPPLRQSWVSCLSRCANLRCSSPCRQGALSRRFGKTFPNFRTSRSRRCSTSSTMEKSSKPSPQAKSASKVVA